MKRELFAELVESIKEGGRILQGTAKPKRSFNYDEPDVCAIRERLGLSQNKFSALLGISTATLRNWEQRRRAKPFRFRSQKSGHSDIASPASRLDGLPDLGTFD